MQSMMVNHYKVDAVFDPRTGALTFKGDVDGDGNIRIASGIHIVTFTLKTEPLDPIFPDAQAMFGEFPITWNQGGTFNILPSPSFTGMWWDRAHCSLVVFNVNTTAGGIAEIFSMQLYYRNIPRRYDPTIINDPPVGG